MSREGDFIARIGRAASVLFRSGDEVSIKPTEDVSNEASLKLKARTEVLSTSHAKLYRSLVAALASDAVVFAKVRLADFLAVSSGGDGLELAIKMDRKYVDFLLCDPFTMKPLAVVELLTPDKSSTNHAVQPKDVFITRALHDAKIKHLRVGDRSHYPIEELRMLLLSKTGLVQTNTSQLNASSVSEPQAAKKTSAAASDTQNDVSHQRLAGVQGEPLGQRENHKSQPAIISHRIATA